MGITRAIFNSDGKTPWLNDKFKICTNGDIYKAAWAPGNVGLIALTCIPSRTSLLQQTYYLCNFSMSCYFLEKMMTYYFVLYTTWNFLSEILTYIYINIIKSVRYFFFVNYNLIIYYKFTG